MATITPAKPSGPAADGSADGPRLHSVATAWLAHPLASMYLVAVPTALLLLIGTLMVWSASSVFAYTQFSGNAYYFVQRQVVWLVLGLIGAIVVQRLPLDWFRRLGWLLFSVAGLLMALTFSPLGYSVKGNRNWLDFGGDGMLRMQPSEFAKVALILWAASLFATKRRYLDDPRHLLIPFLPGAAVMIGLTLLQHDQGTAMIMGLIVLVVLWSVGVSWRVLGSIGAVVLVGAVGLAITQANRLRRLTAFLDPTSDPTGANYQPNQAQYGLASGGWWGVGLGASRQKWGSLSESHTDYVLAIIGEELGLIGTLAILALLLTLGYAGFRIALRSGTFYGRMVAAGITGWLTLQALINIFVVLRLIPVLGVTLPLVSYGGSSLVVNLAAIGLLLACAREEPEAKAFLDRQRTKRPRRRPALSMRRRRAETEAR